jgi:hypothetical protein
LANQVKNNFKFKMEGLANWGRFALLLLVGISLIFFSLPFAAMLLVNPKPFTLLFSLGSLVILLSILQLISLASIMQRSGSLAGFIVYLVSLGLGIIAGLFYLGYMMTITVMSVQVT